MPLEERQRLLRAYRTAVQSYHEAGAGFDEASFHDALQRSEAARGRAEEARAALLKHEHLGAEEKKPVSIVGSTVALFNVDAEQWELFEMAVCGEPPEDALAWAPRARRWVVDARDMAECERGNVKLYFTEAGLGILREAGLEM